MTKKYFDCECSIPEHVIRVWKDYDDENEINISVQLSPYLGFWKRLWVGFKYIFGIKDDQCHWADCYMRQEKINELKEFLG